MRLKYLLLVSFFYLTYGLFSQQSKVDSLQNLINKEGDNLVKFSLLESLAKEEYYTNIEHYLITVDRMMVIANDTKDQFKVAVSNQAKGRYYFRKGNVDSTKLYFNKALATYIELDSLNEIPVIYGNLGGMYLNGSELDSASHYLNKALKINTNTDNQEGAFFNNYNLGVLESSRDNSVLATQYLLSALKNAETINNKRFIAYCTSMLGVLYLEQSIYDEAKNYIEESLKVLKELDDFGGMANQYVNLGKLFNEKESDYLKAISFYKKALPNYNKVDDMRNKAVSLSNIGRNFIQLNQLDSAKVYLNKGLKLSEQTDNIPEIIRTLTNLGEIDLKRNQYKEAENNVIRARELALKDGFQEELADALLLLSDINVEQKNYKGSYNNYRQAQSILDSIKSVERGEKIANLDKKYKAEKKEKEIAQNNSKILEQELDIKSKQRTIWLISAILLAVLSLGLWFLYRRMKSELRKQKLLSAFNEGFQQYLIHKYDLKEREYKLWLKIVDGLSEKELAEYFIKSIDTIKNWRKSLYSKLKQDDELFKQKNAMDLYYKEENLYKNHKN